MFAFAILGGGVAVSTLYFGYKRYTQSRYVKYLEAELNSKKVSYDVEFGKNIDEYVNYLEDLLYSKNVSVATGCVIDTLNKAGLGFCFSSKWIDEKFIYKFPKLRLRLYSEMKNMRFEERVNCVCNAFRRSIDEKEERKRRSVSAISLDGPLRYKEAMDALDAKVNQEETNLMERATRTRVIKELSDAINLPESKDKDKKITAAINILEELYGVRAVGNKSFFNGCDTKRLHDGLDEALSDDVTLDELKNTERNNDLDDAITVPKSIHCDSEYLTALRTLDDLPDVETIDPKVAKEFVREGEAALNSAAGCAGNEINDMLSNKLNKMFRSGDSDVHMDQPDLGSEYRHELELPRNMTDGSVDKTLVPNEEEIIRCIYDKHSNLVNEHTRRARIVEDLLLEVMHI